ncbi:hypothetical protein SAMN02745121_03122 [Nannocystis exedens]|uniref:Uncharacterized protein n=1 Tax=Nannocystis exedens TaxID=54 RepID=A0A1I1Y7E4_9BACT|nr:hypothetical protein NAEX_04849 [Nannocystis exedens]SFE13760.1 hypothetical protein SAMN02745121_03122 [Nannocystis exedens]
MRSLPAMSPASSSALLLAHRGDPEREVGRGRRLDAGVEVAVVGRGQRRQGVDGGDRLLDGGRASAREHPGQRAQLDEPAVEAGMALVEPLGRGLAAHVRGDARGFGAADPLPGVDVAIRAWRAAGTSVRQWVPPVTECEDCVQLTSWPGKNSETGLTSYEPPGLATASSREMASASSCVSLLTT